MKFDMGTKNKKSATNGLKQEQCPNLLASNSKKTTWRLMLISVSSEF